MSQLKAIICYLTYSGNTKETAEFIKDELENNNYKVDMYEIDSGVIPELSQYDKVIIGTFTWGQGGTPDEIKDFVIDVGYKPDNVYVYGTGETQFGDENFCKASVKLAKFYNSEIEPLKIEQSPRGSQEVKVIDWVRKIIDT